MPLPRCLLPGLYAMVLPAVLAVERLPVEDFAREPSASRARLSPDGKRLAFMREYKDKTTLHIADLDRAKTSRLDLGEAVLVNGARKEVGEFAWAGDTRLVITTTVWDSLYGVLAVNWDGAMAVPISGYEDNQVGINRGRPFYHEILHRFLDKDQRILMLDRHAGGAGDPNRPDIQEVDTETGRSP